MTMFLSILVLAAQLTAGAHKAPSAGAPVAERVEIILFTDFQCPYCAELAPAFRRLQSKGIDGVQTTVELKHFPLNIHPAAPLAHQAALAAGEQGKFWEMHDLLFANQSALKRDDLARYAARLGLNMKRFLSDLDSERIKQHIATDVAEGERLRVRGTPTFFVNGKLYSGARSFDQLKDIVQRAQQRMRVMAEVTEELLSRGPADAPVTLEFFADLQSPVTRPAAAVVNQLMNAYPEKVRLQFRSFPLAFHPQAPLAHEAAMAAASQGRFWQFAAYILEHQDSLREQELIEQAGRLGLDRARFAEVLQTHRYAPRVEADVELGTKRGIRGSPVLFVNGDRIDGVPSFEKLVESVESELAVKAKAGHQGGVRQK